ncbi:MAG: Gfo/Idh/MocA family oxidoreductase [Lentisphaerae bacterium]|jgi:predicted dehydrogenase|nr:Gfo/Idh/MocA family oxidoreductase [Lentisphaerota bacterium]MBT4823372.1 Gfo/Idh/MocA family oxidoreductase [Lentisphaerota bacterium]MBT5606653.1 Gfo/Idh/MocA family oxidoreductase [Lentisphaerota bacterium]MBT7057168.1 Gfo/Idh/MocA family oxidoreductase [Lentisphaerota bacterium]MBT7847059.1 Gfo/Idh/MocA family oxidoreductase [Lentisphaerota bacterium]
MADKIVRIGVVGVGGNGQGHCKTMQRADEAKLTAVCDIDPATAERVGKEHDVPYFVKHRDLIKSGLCDAVIVSTPHPVRPPIAIDAAKAGLHVMSEKPLCERVSGGDRMIKAAAEAGITFVVDFQRRTEPAFAKAIEIVKSGRLGKIYRRTLISPEYRSQAYYDSGGWRATWEGEGGGVMMNQSPHVLDLFILLGGMPSRVTGRTETRLHDIEVEDFAEALLEYPDGGTGYFTCSTCEAGPGQMIEIFGDKGKLIYRNGALELYEFEPGIADFTTNSEKMWGGPECKKVPVELEECERGHINIIRNFCRNILFGEERLTPGEEGIKSLEVANAVWLSAERGKPVDLPLSRTAYDRFLAKKRRESTFVKVVKDHRETDPKHKK